MSPLLKNALVIDRASKWNGKKVDLLINNGRIKQIGKNLKAKGKVIEGNSLCVSPGWIDMKVNFRDPGDEQKEDIASGAAAARAGGFTSVVTMPGTSPVMDSKGSVEYIINKAAQHGLRVYPAGSMSKGMKGDQLSEMYDMHQAGARLFSDDDKGVANTGMMKKALLYVKNFGGVVAALPLDRTMAPEASVHEGPVSTALGIEGHPTTAELLRLKRDIDLLRYTESKLHVSGLSSAGGVALIKAAKKEGLAITAEVHLANLLWTDEQMKTYDNNYKVMPPLRSSKDRKALIKGVVDGTIDCISSDHRPEDIEHKKLEFGLASYGASMLESFYGLYLTHLSKDIPIERFVDCLTSGPAQILGFESATIAEGKRAILSVFDKKSQSVFKPLHSKGYNHVAEGMNLVGSVFPI